MLQFDKVPPRPSDDERLALQAVLDAALDAGDVGFTEMYRTQEVFVFDDLSDVADDAEDDESVIFILGWEITTGKDDEDGDEDGEVREFVDAQSALDAIDAYWDAKEAALS